MLLTTAMNFKQGIQGGLEMRPRERRSSFRLFSFGRLQPANRRQMKLQAKKQDKRFHISVVDKCNRLTCILDCSLKWANGLLM